jgi:hypothetical protein
MKVYQIYSEWDIGLENHIFSTKEVARSWAITALKDSGIEEPFDELFEENLIGFQELDFHQ